MKAQKLYIKFKLKFNLVHLLCKINFTTYFLIIQKTVILKLFYFNFK